MSKVITETRLVDAIKNKTFIKNGIPENAEGVKYDFRLSSRVLKASYGRPIDIDAIPEEEKGKVAVEPGEVVFVLTEETLNLPNNIKAILSPKRKLSHEGILVMGGFCIDPLYKGKLLIGLYNFSSTSFPLIPRKKLIAAIFKELEETEMDDFKEPANPINDFPVELIRMMEKYRPISTQSLMDEICKIDQKVDLIKSEIHNREDWFKRFQESLDKHENKMGKILDMIDRETRERHQAEQNLDEKISKLTDKMYDNFSKYTKEAYKIAAFISVGGALFISLVVWMLKIFILKI